MKASQLSFQGKSVRTPYDRDSHHGFIRVNYPPKPPTNCSEKGHPDNHQAKPCDFMPFIEHQKLLSESFSGGHQWILWGLFHNHPHFLGDQGEISSSYWCAHPNLDNRPPNGCGSKSTRTGRFSKGRVFQGALQ